MRSVSSTAAQCVLCVVALTTMVGCTEQFANCSSLSIPPYAGNTCMSEASWQAFLGPNCRPIAITNVGCSGGEFAIHGLDCCGPPNGWSYNDIYPNRPDAQGDTTSNDAGGGSGDTNTPCFTIARTSPTCQDAAKWRQTLTPLCQGPINVIDLQEPCAAGGFKTARTTCCSFSPGPSGDTTVTFDASAGHGDAGPNPPPDSGPLPPGDAGPPPPPPPGDGASSGHDCGAPQG
ncbi:MAG: hypothetical protein KC503_13135 [Myxococcales bacterium]|nr:hypothetical protein [Myxococcales bacterium]